MAALADPKRATRAQREEVSRLKLALRRAQGEAPPRKKAARLNGDGGPPSSAAVGIKVIKA